MIDLTFAFYLEIITEGSRRNECFVGSDASASSGLRDVFERKLVVKASMFILLVVSPDIVRLDFFWNRASSRKERGTPRTVGDPNLQAKETAKRRRQDPQHRKQEQIDEHNG
jgi:hypothetical protein